VHSFDGADGSYPGGGLVQATDRNFYGTTSEGGVNNFGTVFKLTPGGTLTTLYSFCSPDCMEGANPEAALVQDTNGSFVSVTALKPEVTVASGGADWLSSASFRPTMVVKTSASELALARLLNSARLAQALLFRPAARHTCYEPCQFTIASWRFCNLAGRPILEMDRLG
jgi:uncharacterized repeat protein (TIGR03803 family)